MMTAVSGLKVDSAEGRATITVTRRWTGRTALMADLPDDMRQALIEWLRANLRAAAEHLTPTPPAEGGVRDFLYDNGGNDLVCQACGRVNTGWFTDNALWNTTVGDDEATDPGGILCATCFTAEASRAHGIPMWRITPEWSGRAEPMSPIAEPAQTPGVGYGDETARAESTPASLPKIRQTNPTDGGNLRECTALDGGEE